MPRSGMIALLGTALMATTASADYTYNVALSVFNAASSKTTLAARGTITVDRLGSDLTTSDITQYSIAIVSAYNPTVVLTQGNSTLLLRADTLAAGSSVLSLNPQNSGDFTIYANTGSISQISSFDFSTPTGSGATNATTLTITNQSNSSSTPEYGTLRYNTTDPIVLGTATVPEPSSLLLMGPAVLLAWVGATLRRSRPAGSAQPEVGRSVVAAGSAQRPAGLRT